MAVGARRASLAPARACFVSLEPVAAARVSAQLVPPYSFPLVLGPGNWSRAVRLQLFAQDDHHVGAARVVEEVSFEEVGINGCD